MYTRCIQCLCTVHEQSLRTVPVSELVQRLVTSTAYRRRQKTTMPTRRKFIRCIQHTRGIPPALPPPRHAKLPTWGRGSGQGIQTYPTQFVIRNMTQMWTKFTIHRLAVSQSICFFNPARIRTQLKQDCTTRLPLHCFLISAHTHMSKQ